MQAFAHSATHTTGCRSFIVRSTTSASLLNASTSQVLFLRLMRCALCSQVYQVSESALADILAAFQNSFNDLDDKLKQVQAAYDAFTASQFGNFGARPLLQPIPALGRCSQGWCCCCEHGKDCCLGSCMSSLHERAYQPHSVHSYLALFAPSHAH